MKNFKKNNLFLSIIILFSISLVLCITCSSYWYKYEVCSKIDMIPGEIIGSKIEKIKGMYCALHHISHANVIYIKPIYNKNHIYKDTCKLICDCSYTRNYHIGDRYKFREHHMYQEIYTYNCINGVKDHDYWYFVLGTFIFGIASFILLLCMFDVSDDNNL